jgi:SAM-dependent MidA family methyltransferase
MTALESIIRDEIARQGPLPFVRFMELALYLPEFGYYERTPATVGREGDFFTSVSVGPLFGELLARRFANWLDSSGTGRVEIVEAGAHDGRLAADMLGWLHAERPALAARLRYTLLEPSPRRRQWQQARLAAFGDQVRWQPDWEMSEAEATVIFANELLDAFPVHRLGWEAAAGKWIEWGVTVEGDKLVWTRLPLSPELATALTRWLTAGTGWGEPELACLFKVLPDDFVVEISPQAETWWTKAARSLRRGWLVTCDYGFTAGEALRAERMGGTLRAYRQHGVGGDLLATPGEQDLTAQVNFAVMQAAGEAAGLRTMELCRQEQFLTRIAAEVAAPWSAVQTRQLRTLIHPAHLGRAFRVLVQTR